MSGSHLQSSCWAAFMSNSGLRKPLQRALPTTVLGAQLQVPLLCTRDTSLWRLVERAACSRLSPGFSCVCFYISATLVRFSCKSEGHRKHYSTSFLPPSFSSSLPLTLLPSHAPSLFPIFLVLFCFVSFFSLMIYDCEAVGLSGSLFWSLNVSKFVVLAVEEVWSGAGGCY